MKNSKIKSGNSQAKNIKKTSKPIDGQIRAYLLSQVCPGYYDDAF